MRAGLSGWVGSAEVDGEGEGRVRVAWRVVGEGGSLLGVCGEGGGDGREVFR